MAAEVKVTIGADVTGLEEGLNQGKKSIVLFDKTLGELKQQLKNLENGLKSASNEESFNRINRAISATKDRIDNFGKAVPNEIKKVGVAFQGTARVLQDAAFGPGAIANNLAGLGDDFRQLSQQAKDSGQSLTKTLVQSLTGAGGLNLALGGVTLALSLASFGLTAWTRLFGENDKAVKTAKKSTEEYIQSLEAVNEAQLKGGISAQNELANLNTLFHAYENANLPLKTRKAAYDELQDKYPSYFGNLKFEKEITDKTKDAYNSLTSSILATARARAANELIAKNAGQQLVNEQKIADIEAKRPALINAAVNARKALAQARELETGERGAINIRAIQRQAESQQSVEESISATIKLRAENNRLTQENLKLEKAVFTQISQGAFQADKGLKTVNETVKQTKLSFIGLRDTKLALPKIKVPTLTLPEDVRKRVLKFNSIIAQDFIDLGAILTKGFESAFGGIGEAIGTSLAEGTNVLDAFGASILGSIGDILVQFGKLTIAAGVTALALKAALKNPLGPGQAIAAIAAGTAMVAIGSAVKGFSKNIAGGGKGGGGGAGVTGPQSVSSGFNPATPVAGTGNAGPIAFIPNTVIKGTDIVISYNRQSSLNSRSGL